MTNRSLLARLWYSILWCPCWAIATLWFRFRSTGRENVPATGPVLLVSNHQSHLDPVLVGIACPRQMRFLARHTLFFWPLSWLIRSLGAVPIDRDRGGLGGIKATLQLLKENEAMLAFPEGTRTKDGRLQPLLPGFCALARRSGATIVPAAIDGAFAAMPRGSHFPRPWPIRLTFCNPVPPAEQQQLNDDQLSELVAARISASLP
jgi:1-acyl-sn-glycerol-3-phosphate acyltransferase